MTESPLDFPAKKTWSTINVVPVGEMKHEIARSTMAITADAQLNAAAFAYQARSAANRVSAELRELAEDFIVYGDGGLLFTDVPVGPAPPTPESAINDVTHQTLLGKELALLLSLLCHLAGL